MLTTRARELQSELVSAALAVNAAATAGLDKHEITGLMTTLTKVITNLLPQRGQP